MAGRPWTPEEVAQLREAMDAGHTSIAIARRLGRSAASIDCKWKQVRCGEKQLPAVVDKGIPPPPLPEEAQPAPGDDIAKIAREFAKSAGVIQKPEVICEWEDDTDIAELWRMAEEQNAKHITKARLRHNFSVEFSENRPIAICFASDQHIAPGTPVDMQRMRKDAELTRDTDDLYAILVGDGVDNHIKHRNAILAARSQPSDQYQLYEYYLSIMADSILAIASGNHDDWTTQIAGIDMVHRLAQAQKIAYAPDEIRMSITVGGHEYKFAARHQFRFNSTMNQCHTVKQWFRFGPQEFDVGCIAHHHEPSVEMFTAHGKDRWACRPGSYQISSSYSRQYGYNSTYPTCPTFILYPGERRIVGFNDLEAGVRFLKGETA